MDAGDLEVLYQRHRQGLFSLALSITRCAESAEDAVQEAFTRLCRPTIRPCGDAAAFVYAAVRNAALDNRRRQGSALRIAAGLFNGSNSSGQEIVADQERDERIRKSVEGLPEELQDAVLLRVFSGLTFEQMAQALDVPLSTAASRYHRAMEVLAVELRDFA